MKIITIACTNEVHEINYYYMYQQDVFYFRELMSQCRQGKTCFIRVILEEMTSLKVLC